MKIVCTGGRDFEDFEMVHHFLDRLQPKVVHVGDCPTGLDHYVREWCEIEGNPVSITVHHANWEKFGKSAGPRRNRAMLEDAGDNAIVFAFRGGRGTASCTLIALELGMTVCEVKS